LPRRGLKQIAALYRIEAQRAVKSTVMSAFVCDQQQKSVPKKIAVLKKSWYGDHRRAKVCQVHQQRSLNTSPNTGKA